MAFALYAVLAVLVLEAASRALLPISRRDRLVLGLLPLVEAGEAFARGRVLGPIHLASLLLPLPMAITFVAAAMLGASALWMYLLARDLEVRAEIALFAGAAWSYGAFHLFWLGWPVALASSAVPLLVLAARRVACRPGAASAATMAVAWMLLLLGGNPEVALLGGLLAGALFVGQLALRCPDRRTALLAAMAGTALGVALSAVQLVPFLAALPQTAEFAAHHRDNAAGLVAASSETSARLLAENVLPFALGIDAPGLLVRRALEPARATAWIGSVGLAAAIYGFAAARSRWRWALAGFLACGIGLATYLPAAIDLARALPGLSLVRPRYGALWASFALTLLAALGLEAAVRANRRRGFLLACLAAAVAMGGTFACMAPHLAERGVASRDVLVFGLAAVVPLALVAGTVAARGSALLIVALATGGMLAERQSEMGGYYRAFPVEQFYPAIPPLDELARRRDEGRFVALGRAVLHPNTATMWGLEDVRGYDPMALGRLVETFPIWAPDSPRQISRLAALHPFLSFLNVRFALASSPVALPPGWNILRQDPGWTLYENASPLPRIFCPSRIRTGGSDAERLRDLAARTDFRALAWIEPDAARAGANEAANGPCEVAVETRGFGYRIATDCEREAWLATSIPAWRGWQASRAGAALATGIANHAFLAIQVPAGRQAIDLAYRPRSFVVSAALTAAALTLMAAIAWRRPRL